MTEGLLRRILIGLGFHGFPRFFDFVVRVAREEHEVDPHGDDTAFVIPLRIAKVCAVAVSRVGVDAERERVDTLGNPG